MDIALGATKEMESKGLELTDKKKFDVVSNLLVVTATIDGHS